MFAAELFANRDNIKQAMCVCKVATAFMFTAIMFCISDIYNLVCINFLFLFGTGFDELTPLRYPAMLWQINK